jgi:hypothetical protein
LAVLQFQQLCLHIPPDYKSNIFSLVVTLNDLRKIDDKSGLELPSTTHAHSVRHLRLYIDHQWPRDEDDICHEDWSEKKWVFILPASNIPVQSDDPDLKTQSGDPTIKLRRGRELTLTSYNKAIKRSEWPRLFPNLKVFELDVWIDEDGKCDPPTLEKAFSRLGMGPSRVIAKHKTVKVLCEACRINNVRLHVPDKTTYECEEGMQTFLQSVLDGKSRVVEHDKDA